MSRRAKWVWAFIGTTVLALVMEIIAAVVDSEDMPTWTDLIVEHVHWEVFLIAYGALFIWLGGHFGVRFWRKYRNEHER